MRLFEILAPTRNVLASGRFIKELDHEVRANPSFRSLMDGFILDKETASIDSQYGRKDAPFRFGPRKVFRHCHLIYGKRVVTYQLTTTTLLLVALTDHAAYEGKRQGAFDAYLGGLEPSDFKPFHGAPRASDEAPALSSDVLKRITAFAYDLTGPADRYILEAMAGGNLAPIAKFLDLIPVTRPEFAAAFGNSKTRIKDFAAKILRDTQISERTASTTRP